MAFSCEMHTDDFDDTCNTALRKMYVLLLILKCLLMYTGLIYDEIYYSTTIAYMY